MTTPEALNALADRVEREEPSRELDADIFEAAMEQPDHNKADKSFRERGSLLLLTEDDRLNWVYAPAYTSSLDAAVRPERDDVFWRSGHDGEGPDPSLFKAEVLLSDLGRSFTGIARTEAMARRAAELRARAADMQA